MDFICGTQTALYASILHSSCPFGVGVIQHGYDYVQPLSQRHEIKQSAGISMQVHFPNGEMIGPHSEDTHRFVS
jgi:hypothetical protein